MKPIALNATDAHYPACLGKRLGPDALPKLSAFGNLDLLALPKTALFCSARSPGHAILAAYDQAARWRDVGRCIISGFHSPVEKECLSILLRGSQPVIICPARSLENMRLPPNRKKPFSDGRLLILSCFVERNRRVTASLAVRRNELVAALADEVSFAYIAPGGEMQRLAHKIAARD
jgi:predicted Rossmann fold nucleotide-binding protein DprA/Smf involved in DNA uptake